MYCDKCPHQREIYVALEPCQHCDHANLSGVRVIHGDNLAACHTCPHMKDVEAALRPCGVCEAGKIHGEVSADVSAAERKWQERELLRDKPIDTCPLPDDMSLDDDDGADDGEGGAGEVMAPGAADDESAGVTNLPIGVEDALRQAFAILFDFTPMELLLIQHVMHGRNVSTFREPLAELKDRLNRKYDLAEDSKSFRALAHTWKNNIVSKFPPIEKLFAAVTDANKGSPR